MKKVNLNYDEVRTAYDQLHSLRKTAKCFDVSHETISKILKSDIHIKDLEKYNLKNITDKIKKDGASVVCNELGMNEESLSKFIQILELNQKLAKSEQKYRDITNVKGKHFREYVRVDNTLEELSKDIRKYIKNDTFNYENDISIKRNNKDENLGIIHLSDLHLNERVDIKSNEYNWEIASKRLKKFIDKCLDLFSTNNVSNVLVVGTGDFLNSDRRLDELMTNSDNRAKASVLAYKLIRSVLLHISQFYKVTYTFVCGNESRIDQDIQNSKILVSNNFDYMIGLHLYTFFEDFKNVNVILPNNPEEQIIKVFNEYILLVHGHKGIGTDIDNSISKIISKYSRTEGINISYVLYGHIHSALISDNFSRSGSLVGDNEYSFNKLQLTGRASQNCYIFEPDGTKNCFRIDLQNVENINGYNYNKDLESYNTKSKSKTYDETVIVKVII